MRQKNFILALLILFSAICAYNIYYSYVRISQDYALAGMKTDERSEWLKDEDNVKNYKTAVSNSMSLGLDLQGGMYITMEVSVADVIAGLADNPTDSTFVKAIRLAQKNAKGSQEGFVDLFVKSLRAVDPKVKLATYYAGANTGLPFTASDDEVIARLRSESELAIERTFNIIRTRIDQFGVASPNLQRQPGTGRILIELPGVKDAQRVRNLLRGTAKLEFWPTYTIREAFPYLEKANEKVRQLKGLSKDSTQADKDKALADAKKPVQDTTKSSVQEALGQKTGKADTSSKAAKDSLNAQEQQKKFERENPFFAVLRFPDFNRINPNVPSVGYALPTDTAQVNAYLSAPEVRLLFPADMKFMWTAKPEGANSQYLTLVAIKTNREGKAQLTGEYISDTKQDYDQENGGKNPIVTMKMNAEGAKIWKKMTTDYLQKSIAVVLDNMVYTYPTVQNVIANGNSQISGSFTVDEAKDLANILKAGKLPAPANIEGYEVVGPSLGTDTTEKGLISFGLGFLSVILFMVLYYRGSGIIASIALLVNLFLVLGVMGAMNVVLTLPGIAGIVLSLAMAVDSNVLIYERIREELELGRNFRSAVNAGFQNALSAIVDGNLTTLLTGIILYAFGTGPIRGFAVTLVIGIITTLVSALIVTRLILEYLSDKSETTTIQFGNPAASKFFNGVSLNLIGTRKTAYLVLGTLAVASMVAIAAFGFKLGVDFKGGRQYRVAFKQTPDIETVRRDLTKAFAGDAPVIKTVSSENQLMVTTSYLYGTDDRDADEKVPAILLAGLEANFGKDVQILSTTSVGPTVAEDIKTGAVQAVIFSLIGMFIYIFARFRRWQFGVSAVISLAFNVLLVLGLFAILGSVDGLFFNAELDQNLLAALLTIVGYTINDTVVVFDRIRETAVLGTPRSSLPGLYNRALNDTFSRTVVTSVTTIVSAAILFFLGGDVLKGFMLALIWGIVVGTFSSLMVASPIALDLELRGAAAPQQAAEPEKVRA